MKKILFVIKDYYPTLSASGHVLHLLVNAANQFDLSVGIVCRNAGESRNCETACDNVKVYRYADKKKNNVVLNTANKFYKQVDIRLYSCEMKDVVNAIEYMVDRYGYETLIPITIDELYASLHCKKKKPELKLVPFLFEKIPTYDSFFAANWLRKRKESRLKEELLVSSKHVVVFPTLKDYFLNDEKTVVVDHPMVIDNTSDKKEEPRSRITITYVGGLDRRIRNPQRVLEIFSALFLEMKSHAKQIFVDFYGYGNCDDLLRDYERNHKTEFKYHGAVDADTASKVMKSSDIVMTIGNRKTSLVPSKIFDCISTGNPIIHFYFEKDSYIDRLKKYPCSICIDLSENSSNNAHRIINFIDNNNGKQVGYEYIKKEYEECTPEYVLKQIIEIC